MQHTTISQQTCLELPLVLLTDHSCDADVMAARSPHIGLRLLSVSQALDTQSSAEALCHRTEVGGGKEAPALPLRTLATSANPDLGLARSLTEPEHQPEPLQSDLAQRPG